MTVEAFNDGWTVTPADTDAAVPVTLPHDAMIGEARDPAETSHSSYFPGGTYVYEKSWTPAVEPGKSQRLRFEGVYGRTVITLNGRKVGSNASPYREFEVLLDDALLEGEINRLKVVVDNSLTPNSRWYTGSGIYRPVWLVTTDAAHFLADGVRVSTVSIGERALLRVETEVADTSTSELRVQVAVRWDGRVVAESSGPVGELLVEVRDPQLWSDRTPHLYEVETTLAEGDRIRDVRLDRIGIRTVSVDFEHGLRINGIETKLRGACIHHDSGILGAATFRAFEFRRARILKENGFNAVRSSHNPLSRAMLDACDEVGLFVLDELTDVWFAPKTKHDGAADFESIWPDDAASMVAKDRNHASVIMYSIGNEVAESSTPGGVEVANRIARFLDDLDPTRPTTLAVNFLLNVIASQGWSWSPAEDKPAGKPKEKKSFATSTMANLLANKIGPLIQFVSRLPKADKVTRDAFAAVDVAGYNYAWSRYRSDARRHPSRVVLGSESMPGDIAKAWPLVEAMPNVIGDFMWTGWDYLGETGLGVWTYEDEPAALAKPYPYITSGCGAIDIVGTPGAPVLLAEAAWGLLDAPAIAVRPLNHAGERTLRMAWRSTDALPSWAWRGSDGTQAEIEVFSDCDEIELFVNGTRIGRKRAGVMVGNVTRFRTPYEQGTIVAVGYKDGAVQSRTELRSANQSTLALTLTPESATLRADGQDLAFVWVQIQDADGIVEMLDDDQVTISVSGPVTLAGYGNGAPKTDRPYADPRQDTYFGRALVVLRATNETGVVTLTAESRRHGRTSVTLCAEGAGMNADHREGVTGN